MQHPGLATPTSVVTLGIASDEQIKKCLDYLLEITTEIATGTDTGVNSSIGPQDVCFSTHARACRHVHSASTACSPMVHH